MSEGSDSPVPGMGSAGPVAFLLAQLGAFAAMRFAERLAGLELTPPHAGLLRAVAAEPGRSQRALSQQLGLVPSRLVVLIDELERADLVERRRDPDDRRHYLLHITEAGARRLRDIGKVAREHGEDLLAPLTAQERAELARLLTGLAAHHGLAAGVHPGYRALR